MMNGQGPNTLKEDLMQKIEIDSFLDFQYVSAPEFSPCACKSFRTYAGVQLQPWQELLMMLPP